MADELNIKVALTEELKKIEKAHGDLISNNSSDYSKENQSRVSFGISRLQQAIKQDELTLDDLKNFRKIHKEIITILTDVLLKEKQVTKEFTESVNKVTKITGEVEKARKKLEALRNIGSVTEEKGVVLKSTYIAEQIEGLTYRSGRHARDQVQATSFWKEGGREDFSLYSDPDKAQRIYKSLQTTAEGLPNQFSKAVEAIRTLENALQEAKEEAEKLQKTGNINEGKRR